MLAFATLIAAASSVVPAHEMTVDHAGTQYQVSYAPIISTRLRTVGTSAGPRPSTERCRWTATVDVHRSFAANGTASSPVTLGALTLSGSKPGHCTQARTAIDAEIAGMADEVRAHVLRVAEQDGEGVRSDIARTRKLAGN